MRPLFGNDFLAALTTILTTLVSNALKEFLGAGVDHPVLGPITWGDLAATGCLALLALLFSGLATAVLRRKITEAASSDSKSLQPRLLGTLDKPVRFLLGFFCFYIAAMPLLLKLPGDREFAAFRSMLDQLFDLGVFVGLFWLFFRFTRVVEARLADWAANTGNRLDGLFVPLIGRSLRVIVPVVGVIFALPVLKLSPAYAAVFSKGGSILLILAVAVILFQAVGVGEKVVLTRYDVTAADNLRARKVYTQVHVLGKTLCVVISLFTAASILMLFDEVRHFGASILASAGVVGIIIGFAAQKTISNLFAGFQLAMTQPIRLDDVVVVEGEWGRIEEVTLTYVVIRIWDDRRLVVPLSYFIEKPFQNWTRVSANLLGSVFVWVDYSLPLSEIRQALEEIIKTNPLWDKRFWNLQVTDANERAMQIRVLATSADSSKSWDLRCAIREQLIAYIQKNHPQSLPRFHAQLESPAGEPSLKP